ncbi:MAG: hypothetical protein L3J26_11935 [Candidatus Polarisedimenticolaceae bacterium]|nr:hypothetical protein [Candidatus Polarisedimenticolaceae bacterium]
MQSTLVIDQGTHASRAILYSASGELIDQVEAPVDLVRIDHEQIEQDPQQILESIQYVLATLLARNRLPVGRAALATQRSTVLAWDKRDGRALSPALSWQDRRALHDLMQFKSEEADIYRLTGLPLSPHYGAGKLRWLLHANKEVQQARKDQILSLGPLVSYILYHLLSDAPHLVDHSNAHRTLLFDLATLSWSKPLFKLFDIPMCPLPLVRPMQGMWGRLTERAIPLTAVCGDQNAALFSQGDLPEDTAVVNLGTGAFILMPTHAMLPQPMGLLQGVAKSDGESRLYLIEGTVNGAGAALSWAQQQWPVDDLFEQLDEWLAQVKSPPIFINTVGGLGSPWWKGACSPYFMSHTDAAVKNRYVAIIESIVFLLQCNLERLQQIKQLTRLRVGGGLSQLDGLCQRLADLSGLQVDRFQALESSARGAAWLAMGSTKKWQKPAIDKVFMPNQNPALQKRYERFSKEIKVLCDG